MINFEILIDRSTILVSGKDALKFLQNYTTNDLEKYSYSYNYMLNNQGRYLFDFFVYKYITKLGENLFYIDIASQRAKDFIQHLSFYKLRSDVIIEDVSSEFNSLYITPAFKVEGACDIGCFGYLETISKYLVYYAQDPRFSSLGYRALARKDYTFDKKQMSLRSGLYLQHKYDYTIVDGYFDLILEKSIPIEFGGEELCAINFNKGCYIGQEVISRAKHQGVVRKKIYKVTGRILQLLGNATPKQKINLLCSNGEKLGLLLSWRGEIGIAQIREENFMPLKQNEKLLLDKQSLDMIELREACIGAYDDYTLTSEKPSWR